MTAIVRILEVVPSLIKRAENSSSECSGDSFASKLINSEARSLKQNKDEVRSFPLVENKKSSKALTADWNNSGISLSTAQPTPEEREVVDGEFFDLEAVGGVLSNNLGVLAIDAPVEVGIVMDALALEGVGAQVAESLGESGIAMMGTREARTEDLARTTSESMDGLLSEYDFNDGATQEAILGQDVILDIAELPSFLERKIVSADEEETITFPVEDGIDGQQIIRAPVDDGIDGQQIIRADRGSVVSAVNIAREPDEVSAPFFGEGYIREEEIADEIITDEAAPLNPLEVQQEQENIAPYQVGVAAPIIFAQAASEFSASEMSSEKDIKAKNLFDNKDEIILDSGEMAESELFAEAEFAISGVGREERSFVRSPASQHSVSHSLKTDDANAYNGIPNDDAVDLSLFDSSQERGAENVDKSASSSFRLEEAAKGFATEDSYNVGTSFRDLAAGNIKFAEVTSESHSLPTPAEQISVNIREAVITGKQTMTISLTPEHLGAVEIKLDISNGSVKDIRITAHNIETLDAIIKDSVILEQTVREILKSESDLSFSYRHESDNGGYSGNESSSRAPANYGKSYVAVSEITTRENIVTKDHVDVSI